MAVLDFFTLVVLEAAHGIPLLHMDDSDCHI